MSAYGDLVTTDPVINAESRQSTLIAVLIAFPIVSVVAISLRLYTRVYMLRYAGPDDISICVAELFALATTFATGMEVRYGLGRHTWTVSLEDKMIQLRYLYVVLFVYNLTLNIIKFSILLQYRRLFPGKWMLRICNVSLVFVTLWAITQVTLLATACLPISTLVPSMVGKCLPTDPIWYLSSATNIVTDFAVFLLPLPSLYKLRVVRKKQKVMLILIFCIGFFTCIISIIRILALGQRTSSPDSFWTAVTPVCWSIVEIHTGILCSCLATLRPLIRRFLPHLSDSANGNYELEITQSAFYKRSRTVGGGVPSKTQPHPPSSRSVKALDTDCSSKQSDEFLPTGSGIGHETHVYCGKNDQGGSIDDLGAALAEETLSTGGKLQVYTHRSFETKLSSVVPDKQSV